MTMMLMETNNIRANPLNAVIYGDLDLCGLKEDIENNGVLSPLVINQKGLLISGHRRLQVAKDLSIKQVPVDIIETTNDEHIADLLISYNKQRSKTIRAIYHEGQQLSKTFTRKSYQDGKNGKTIEDRIAIALGLSKGNMHRINKLCSNESTDTRAKSLVDAVISGTKSIGQAYKKYMEILNIDILHAEAAKKLNHGISLDEVRLGDFRKVLSDIPDNSVDLVLTDPPYPHEYITLFGELAKFASKKLRPGGWLVFYSGELYLDEVFSQMTDNKSDGLDYYWTMCLYHQSSCQLVQTVNMQAGWKPILVYRKGEGKIQRSGLDVIISEKREKDGHEWQQSRSGVKQLIERFSNEGDFVVDPFAGSGTVIKCCGELNRKSIGAEIDPEYHAGVE
jgi:site-specific DNA-adenine methylase